jgi:hypothetical protein
MQASFFKKTITQKDGAPAQLDASIQFNDAEFGVAEGPSPFTISVSADGHDLGRIVGFEGQGAKIIGMHGLKPDVDAVRGFEFTVYRMSELLVAQKLDQAVFAALERWLLKRGWRGNIIKRMKFTDPAQVLPIRTFWINLGFELITWTDQWDEHVVKRWR